MAVSQMEQAYVPLRLRAASGSRREYAVTFIQAGAVKQRDGTAANWVIPAETLQRAAAKLEGVAVFVDHVQGAEYPSVRDLVGVTFEAQYNAARQRIDGKLRLYQGAEWLAQLLDEVLADQSAGEVVPDVGLSLVFYGDHEQQNGRRITRTITHVESCDVVFSPAAEGRIRTALSRVGRPAISRAGDNSSCMKGKGQGIMTEQAESRSLLESLLSQVERLAQVVQAEEQADIATLSQRVAALTQAVAGREERRAVRGFGVPHRTAATHISGQTELERFGSVVDWLFGVPGTDLPDPQFRRADLIYTYLTGDYEFRGLFDPERAMLATATTSTLANMATNAMNKVIVAQMSALTFWRWYERVAYVTPNDSSLQEMQFVTFGGVANLPTVDEGAVYTELTVDDVKESAAFVKRGGYVGITRAMLKNSNIAQIQAIPRTLAMATVRSRSAAVSALFTAASGVGPTLSQDSKALFHADHNNLDTVALDVDSWRAARTECFKHVDVHSGKALSVFPRYVLVPPDLYDSALSILGYGEGMPTTYTPEAQDRGFEDPRPVPLAVPDWTDANNWAYLVDPQVYPVIHMSYSQAPGGGVHPGPELYAVVNEANGLMFTHDVMPIKVRDEFAVGVNGPRGIGKRNVT